MSKKYSIFITILFCLFIFGLGAVLLASPEKDFSENENRYLAQFEPPTLESIFSGEFMESFEDYVVDQFPLRDWWIGLKARCEVLLDKRENNGVYFGTDGFTLFAHFTTPDQDQTVRKTDFVNALAGHIDVPVYFSIIPDKSHEWAGLLPENAPNADDGSMAAAAAGACSDQVTYVDLYGTLEDAFTFYGTDHHWSTPGAYLGYQTLAQAMNGSFTRPAGSAALVADDFYGTTWSAAGADWIAPDMIFTLVDEDTVDVTRYPNGEPVEGELYDESWLETKDKYSMFLGGNQPLCVLENENAQGGRLLVVRDSYCDALAPFLAQDYSQVHLIDLRYYKASLPEYIRANGIDQVLVLYSAANFSTDTNLFLMAME